MTELLHSFDVFSWYFLPDQTIFPMSAPAPITATLFGLIFRGVAFEFRWRTEKGKFLWDWAFAGGAIMAAFAQGIALGALERFIV